MDGAGRFADIIARTRDPVVLEIAPTTLQHVTEDGTAVAVASQHSALRHPQNVREGIAPHIESQVPDVNAWRPGHPRRFLLAFADVYRRPAELADHRRPAAAFGFNNGHS